MIRSRFGRSSFALALVVTAFAGQAFAQDQAAIEKLVQMNKKALDDYDTLEWDGAKKTLLDALVAGKKAGLDNHPVMARTYVHLGAVYITGFKNRDKAIQSFTRALEIDPAIQLSKGIATREVTDAFNEAKGSRGGAAAGGGGGETQPAKKRRGPVMDNGGGEGEEPPRKKKAPVKSSTSDDDESEERDLPVKITALDCDNEDEAIIDRPATLRCAVKPTLGVAKVFLLYQEPGKEEYTELEMKKSPKGWYVGKIPKKAVTGKSVKFYFEGRNMDGCDNEFATYAHGTQGMAIFSQAGHMPSKARNASGMSRDAPRDRFNDCGQVCHSIAIACASANRGSFGKRAMTCLRCSISSSALPRSAHGLPIMNS